MVVFSLGLIVVVGPVFLHLDSIFDEDPFAPGVETETVERTAPDGTTTTERTTRPASTSALQRTLASGGLLMLRLGVVALAAFLAGAVVQRTLRGNFAIEVGAGGIKVPPEVRQAASQSARATVELGAAVQALATLVEGVERDLQRREADLVESADADSHDVADLRARAARLQAGAAARLATIDELERMGPELIDRLAEPVATLRRIGGLAPKDLHALVEERRTR